MSKITTILKRFKAGEIDMQAVIDRLNGTTFAGKDEDEGEEGENPGAFEGGWLEVQGAKDGPDPLLTEDEYWAIKRAIFGEDDEASKALVAEMARMTKAILADRATPGPSIIYADRIT